MARNIYIDLTGRSFLSSPSGGNAALAPFYVGNAEVLNLYFLQQTGLVAQPFEFLDKSGASLKVGLGAVAGEPTGGFWTVTMSGVTSGAIAPNATTTQIATAISTVVTGGVSVSGSLESGYFVTWLTAGGNASLLSVNAGNLYPASVASVNSRVNGYPGGYAIQEIIISCDAGSSASSFSSLSTSVTASTTLSVTGTTSANAVQKLSFTKIPATGTFTLTLPGVTIPSTTAAVTGGVFTTAANHGLSSSQRVVLSGFNGLTGGVTSGIAYQVYKVPSPTTFTLRDPAQLAAITTASTGSTAGAPSITTFTEGTTPIPVAADAPTLQKSLEGLNAIGPGNVKVSGIPGENFSFYFCKEKGLASVPLLTVSGDYAAAPGLTGTLSVTAPAMADLIGDLAQVPATFEVQLTESGNKLTAAQTPVTLGQTIFP